MSNLQEMLEIAGSLDNAEEIAKNMINNGLKEVILDLQLIYAAQGKLDEVDKLEKECDKYIPFNNRRAFNLGWRELHSGNFEKGMKYLFDSRKENLFGNPPMLTNKPMWDGTQELKNKTIVLFCEGGLGDEIINIRFAKFFKEKHATVIAMCNESLMNVFKNVDGVDVVVNKKYQQSVCHDYWIPCMSAPLFCNYNYDTLPGEPYIQPIINDGWDYVIPKTNRLNIGIRWAGNPKFEHEQFRKFPLKPLFDLSNNDNVQLYSFQRDDNLTKLPENIIDLEPLIKTWDDTSCALNKMDLIITSCTSVAHLSAAMGKNTWIIVPIMPYYLWAMDGNKSKWYNTVTLFRQKKFDDWTEPFKNIHLELENLCKKRFT